MLRSAQIAFCLLFTSDQIGSYDILIGTISLSLYFIDIACRSKNFDYLAMKLLLHGLSDSVCDLWMDRNLSNSSSWISFGLIDHSEAYINYLPALVTGDSVSLSSVSLFVAEATLNCDVRLSDRLNVSRKLRSDDNDVDFFGDALTELTSSSLSARTYKLPIFSLIFLFSTKNIKNYNKTH